MVRPVGREGRAVRVFPSVRPGVVMGVDPDEKLLKVSFLQAGFHSSRASRLLALACMRPEKE